MITVQTSVHFLSESSSSGGPATLNIGRQVDISTLTMNLFFPQTSKVISITKVLNTQDQASYTITHPKYEDETKHFDLNFTVFFANNNKCPAIPHNRDTEML